MEKSALQHHHKVLFGDGAASKKDEGEEDLEGLSEDERMVKRREILQKIYKSLDEKPSMSDLRGIEPLLYVRYRKIVGDIRQKNL